MPYFGLDTIRKLVRSRVVGRYSRYVTYKPFDVLVFRDGPYAVAIDKKGKLIAKDTDHAEVIQKAIDYVASKGGGKIYINRGVYELDAPIKLKSGIHIEGVCPKRKNIHPSSPDLPQAVVEGGTILVGDGTFPAFTSDGDLVGVIIENIGIRNVSYGIKFGDYNVLGLAWSIIRNVHMDEITECGIWIKNLQHIRIDFVSIMTKDRARIAYFAIDNDSWHGGNSVITELYGMIDGKCPDGAIILESIKYFINLMLFNRLQVNIGEGDGTGIILLLKGAKFNTFLGLDVESFRGSVYCGVGLTDASNGNFIEITSAHGEYAVRIEGGVDNIILIHGYTPSQRIYSADARNIVIGQYKYCEGGFTSCNIKLTETGWVPFINTKGCRGIALGDEHGIDLSGLLYGRFILGQKGIGVRVPAGSSYVDITLPREEPDANYGVVVVPYWETTYWISNKTKTGFRVNFGTTPTNDSYIDWFIFR